MDNRKFPKTLAQEISDFILLKYRSSEDNAFIKNVNKNQLAGVVMAMHSSLINQINIYPFGLYHHVYLQEKKNDICLYFRDNYFPFSQVLTIGQVYADQYPLLNVRASTYLGCLPIPFTDNLSPDNREGFSMEHCSVIKMDKRIFRQVLLVDILSNQSLSLDLEKLTARDRAITTIRQYNEEFVNLNPMLLQIHPGENKWSESYPLGQALLNFIDTNLITLCPSIENFKEREGMISAWQELEDDIIFIFESTINKGQMKEISSAFNKIYYKISSIREENTIHQDIKNYYLSFNKYRFINEMLMDFFSSPIHYNPKFTANFFKTNEEIQLEFDEFDKNCGKEILFSEMQASEEKMANDTLSPVNELNNLLAQYCVSEVPLNKIFALIYLGADPNQKDKKGDSILHELINLNINGNYNQEINDLITLYQADVDIRDAHDLSPFQHALRRLDYVNAMLLVRLGADPNENSAWNEPESLENIINCLQNDDTRSELLAELNAYKNIYDNDIIKKSRQDFISLLVLLSIDRHNPNSHSYSKELPLNCLMHIIKFIDFDFMDKSPLEQNKLAVSILKRKDIKKKITTPGGFHIFQTHDEEKNKIHFKFFKSAKQLCDDYLDLKNHLKTEKRESSFIDKMINKFNGNKATKNSLIQFREQYANKYLTEHLSLFKRECNQRRLLDKIKDSELYTPIDLERFKLK